MQKEFVLPSLVELYIYIYVYLLSSLALPRLSSFAFKKDTFPRSPGSWSICDLELLENLSS